MAFELFLVYLVSIIFGIGYHFRCHKIWKIKCDKFKDELDDISESNTVLQLKYEAACSKIKAIHDVTK